MIGKWPRYCELLLGVWLLLSVWVLQQPLPIIYGVTAVAGALAIIVLDLLAISERFLYAHLVLLLVSAVLTGVAFALLPHQSSGAQNLITVALLLAIFAILPTEATLPPRSWRDFNSRLR